MTSPREFPMWQEVYRQHGDSLPRASVQMHIPVGSGQGERVAKAIPELPYQYGAGDHRLRVGPIKLFVDGGYTGPAAWTLEHYRNQPDYYGHARLSAHDLFLVLEAAHQAGWQVGMHTIGDAAIKTAVEELVKVLEKHPKPDHRHYLNHFTVMPPAATMRAMATHNILLAQQPNFTYTIEGRYVAYLEGERLQTNNPVRTPMSHGIFVSLGADIMPTGPLLGIYAAVTRRGMSGAVYGAGERISVPEAIVAYTRNGAYFTFEEAVKGTLEPGRLADFVVLAEDIITTEPDRIKDVKVDLTVLGGRVVYDREAEASRARP
jgi:predicted amidohydrolase YtcJ